MDEVRPIGVQDRHAAVAQADEVRDCPISNLDIAPHKKRLNGATTAVNALSATRTATSLAGGSPELGLFTDGANAFTGAITASASQGTGFAGRIAVNPALLGDPTKLTIFGPGIANGDETRPNFLYQQLTGTG